MGNSNEDNKNKQLKVLLATTECVPFIKTGGLADVCGSLPKYLKNLGVDIRVILPKYGLIANNLRKKIEHIKAIRVKVGWRNAYCGIETLIYEGITYYFIDNEYYFKRDSLYGHYDDGERFAFFSRAILDVIAHIDFIPNIIHLNDWHLGMTPLMYQLDYKKLHLYKNIKTVLTIHNLSYQGSFDLSVLTDLCNISDEYFYNGTVRHNEKVNFLKTGIVTADYLTTVSENYAEEILNVEFGEGLDSVLKLRRNSLVGILNGIDTLLYNPQTDRNITYNYDYNCLNNKYLNKAELQKYFQLEVNQNVPIISIVSRLVEQKGIDLLVKGFDELMEYNVQVIILGSGDSYYESFFKEISSKYVNKVKVYIGFDIKLAQLIYAGSDFLLMPSRFEPCGLSQMIAMRYGTIPIVREVGGLKDSVISYNEINMTGDGFSFKTYSALDMLNMVIYALDIYHKKDDFNVLIKNAMNKDFSWEKSALCYQRLYDKLIK